MGYDSIKSESESEKEATQTAEHIIEIARKKAKDLTNQFREVEQQERVQSQEQDIAQRLMNEAAKTGDMQTATVAHIMLDSGNDKLNGAMKQLVNARVCKEKVQSKLIIKVQGILREMTMERSTDEQPSRPSAKRHTSSPVYCWVCGQRS